MKQWKVQTSYIYTPGILEEHCKILSEFSELIQDYRVASAFTFKAVFHLMQELMFNDTSFEGYWYSETVE